MTAAHAHDRNDRNDRNRSTGLVGSGLRWLGAIFANVVAARERQMQHRVRAVVESLGQERLAAHGLERRQRSDAAARRTTVDAAAD
jgi:hypothetical protein